MNAVGRCRKRPSWYLLGTSMLPKTKGDMHPIGQYPSQEEALAAARELLYTLNPWLRDPGQPRHVWNQVSIFRGCLDGSEEGELVLSIFPGQGLAGEREVRI
jgi:hypothetical protein